MNWIVIMVGAGLGVCLAGMVGEWLAWRRERLEKLPNPKGHYLVVPRTPTPQGQRQALICTIRFCCLLGLPLPTRCYMITPDKTPVVKETKYTTKRKEKP